MTEQPLREGEGPPDTDAMAADAYREHSQKHAGCRAPILHRVINLARAEARATAGAVEGADPWPDRIVIGANGACWYDWGTHYSMAIASEDNDPIEVVAEYLRFRQSPIRKRVNGVVETDNDTPFFEEASEEALGRTTTPEAPASPPPLDEAFRAVEDALTERPYPGTTEPGGWGIQLYGYPSNQPYGPDPDDRYHAMTTPTLDSHHRNMVRATGPTPVEALQRLLSALASAAPSEPGEPE